MTAIVLPGYVEDLLGRFQNVQPGADGWAARCPCPTHNPGSGHPGDQHPSLRIALAENGRILLKCRVGCKTEDVLDAVGLELRSLFPPQDYAGPEPELGVDHTAGDAPPASDHHRDYDLLLDQLELSVDHRQQLLARGLTDEKIELNKYRSLRNVDRGRAARAVHGVVGDQLLEVPGFTSGNYGVTLAGTATGLLIPVRDLTGHIQAIKIRRQGDPKYLYLSEPGGNSSGSPVHVPLGTPVAAPVVRATEGELKADVCWALDGTPTISVPGVTQWRSAISVLQTMEAKTVIVAFDAPEMREKIPVFEQAKAFWLALVSEGFNVVIEEW